MDLILKSNGKEFRTQTLDLTVEFCDGVIELIECASKKDINNQDLFNLIVRNYKNVKQLIRKLFPEMTDEDEKNLSIKEVVEFFKVSVQFVLGQFGRLNRGKN